MLASVPLQFDMPPLQVGTMLRTPPGSRTTIPYFPDMTTDGYAWVVASSPELLRIRERARVWRGVPATFDQLFQLTAPGVVDFTVRATAFGVTLPTLHKRYRLLDAGRGWLQLQSAGRPGERPGSFRVSGGALHVDLAGPMGTWDSKVEPIFQPGEAGYVQPPTGWLSV